MGSEIELDSSASAEGVELSMISTFALASNRDACSDLMIDELGGGGDDDVMNSANGPGGVMKGDEGDVERKRIVNCIKHNGQSR